MKKFCSAFRPLGWVLLLLGWAASNPTIAQPAGCTGTDPGGNPATNGLYAEYYSGYFNDDHSFFTAGPAPLARVDAQVNFATDDGWGNIVPPASNNLSNPDEYSARWRGSILIPVTGAYTFYLTSDDASYLWLDDDALDLPAQSSRAAIDNGGAHGAITRQVTRTLTAGLHNVLIHFGENLYGNTVVWEWASADAGIVRAPVPSSVLCTRVLLTKQLPQSISYVPATAETPSGTAVSSAVPLVNDGGLPVTGFAIANAALLPPGISINAATGVLTANASVPTGVYPVSVTVTNADGSSTFANAFSFDILPPPPSGCAGTDPGGNGARAGLYLEVFAGYFADDPAYFTANTPALQRVQSTVNFTANNSWGNITPPATGTPTNPDEFSAQLRGSILAPVAGFYTFYLTSDDGSFMWLDNAARAAPAQLSAALIRNGGFHGPETEQATVYLTPGLHNVLIHYGESGGGNVLTLEWSSAAAGIARQVVPQQALCSVVQPLRFPPLALSYAPASRSMVQGSTSSSPVPTVNDNGHPPIVAFVPADPAGLPAGLSLNASTGVLTADATLAQGSYPIDLLVTNPEGAGLFRAAFTFVVTPPPPPSCAGANPEGQPATSGLYGEYYAGYFDDEADRQAYFKNNTPLIRRVESRINFLTAADWGAIVPPAQGDESNPDRFSARFRGSIYVATPGRYTFYLTSDDASYLWVDNAALASVPETNAALIRNGNGHPPITIADSVVLTAGLHNILIHYGEYVGGNVLQLEWSNRSAGIARQLVATTSFCTVQQPARPLPVSLTRFEARPKGAAVDVSWETAQERNNRYFEVERSADGRSYLALARLPGAGDAAEPRRYQHLDAQPLPGIAYYRLRQVDFDGTTTTSAPVAVLMPRTPGRGPAATVHPNPSQGRFVLRLAEPAEAGTGLELLDLRGRRVHEAVVPVNAREQVVEVPGLSKGVYLLRLTSPAGRSTQRLVIE
ncbi:PA14 domain-containing protein [Hymenobacter sp. B81]|uniref:PA14 domain-containing protein n=1 Tax=Hymenobacter sp. B81 TaxID=3344878 RepID=UPI0037DC3E13